MTNLVNDLQNKLPDLDNWAASKAASLLDFYSRKGYWTSGQERFAASLISRNGQPDSADVGNMGKLIDLLKKAGQHLRFPKISLEVDGHPVRLSLAGSRAKVPGSITVTDGGPFGANRYYGRVLPDGTWQKPFKAFPELDKVETLLTDMSDDPAATAAKHGHLTGNCCFCNRALSDDASTAVGYGPVCAQHYGLPWGHASSNKAA